MLLLYIGAKASPQGDKKERFRIPELKFPPSAAAVNVSPSVMKHFVLFFVYDYWPICAHICTFPPLKLL